MIPHAVEAAPFELGETVLPGEPEENQGGQPQRRWRAGDHGDPDGCDGNASEWRIIAHANGIDDPMHLTVGRELLIPPLY